MIDADAEVRRYLAGIPALAAWFGKRIYAAVNLPMGYKIEDGPALLFAMRGGTQDYSSRVIRPSYQFRLYAGTEADARKSAALLYDNLNDKSSGAIKMARLEVLPTLLRDQETDWPFMLAFYQLQIAN